jgi:excisionase family DNA binding protein
MITVPEAARRAAKDPETIRRWIRSGRLPARKVGTQHVIEERDLDELLHADEVLGVPAGWLETWTGEPMPNWVSVLRADRAEH